MNPQSLIKKLLNLEIDLNNLTPEMAINKIASSLDFNHFTLPYAFKWNKYKMGLIQVEDDEIRILLNYKEETKTIQFNRITIESKKAQRETSFNFDIYNNKFRELSSIFQAIQYIKNGITPEDYRT